MPNDAVLAWVNYARNDIEAGLVLMNSVRNPRLRPYEIILHHCHQCAEKMLKAYLLHFFGGFDKIHVLEYLRVACTAHDNGFNGKRMIDHCIYLDTFWNVKYPDFTVSVDAILATRGINSAKRIYDFVSERIGLGKVYYP